MRQPSARDWAEIAVRGVAVAIAAHSIPAVISHGVYELRRANLDWTAFASSPWTFREFLLLAMSLASFWCAPWLAARALHRESR